jgi:pimeloyl-ACP methyl ester carboxylesterase
MPRFDVEFQSEGTTCRGWVFRPDGAGPFPAVVLAGGWCYVRELVMPYYAEALPFPETYHTFRALRESEAPLYQNRSTVESVDLLLEYDVVPFARRIYDTPSLMIVAEADDLTLWDLEIGAFHAIPTAKKELVTLPHTTHMTLYSDQAKLQTAAKHATSWFAEHLRP